MRVKPLDPGSCASTFAHLRKPKRGAVREGVRPPRSEAAVHCFHRGVTERHYSGARLATHFDRPEVSVQPGCSHREQLADADAGVVERKHDRSISASWTRSTGKSSTVGSDIFANGDFSTSASLAQS